MAHIYPVIMAGGSGTRLWPLSRAHHPKQFQPVLGARSMFQETVLRVQGVAGDYSFAKPSIIGGGKFADLIDAQLAELGLEAERVVLEPFGKNTAAVAAIAAAIPPNEDDLVLLLPSDHFISEPQAFRDAVGIAAPVAAEHYITTFGIAAREPETGYGYIHRGEPLSQSCYKFEAFKEKPDLDTAKTYVADGNYSWNAGIFLFTAKAMREDLAAYAGDIQAASLVALEKGATTGAVTHLDPDAFAEVDDDSIDFAVMENTQRGAVYGPLECGWSDIGSWKAISELSDESEIGDVICVDTDDCYVRSDGEIALGVIGVSDLVVVAHEGAVLVAPKDRVQDVKAIVNQLKAAKRTDRL